MMTGGIPTRTAAVALGAILSAIALLTVVMLIATVQSGGAMVVLVGLSDSVSANRAAIDDCSRRAIAHAVSDGAELTVLPVGSVPAELRTKAINSSLSITKRLTPGKAKTRQDAARRDAKRRLNQLQAGLQPEGASDTIAAASIAAETLRQSSADGPRTLAVCDDGHVVSKITDTDFGKGLLTDDRAAEVLRRMPPTDLSGVDVVFGAVNTDGKVKLSYDREAAIARFWRVHWPRAVSTRSPAYDVQPRFPEQ